LQQVLAVKLIEQGYDSGGVAVESASVCGTEARLGPPVF
jgi:hypothetical protein